MIPWIPWSFWWNRQFLFDLQFSTFSCILHTFTGNSGCPKFVNPALISYDLFVRQVLILNWTYDIHMVPSRANYWLRKWTEPVSMVGTIEIVQMRDLFWNRRDMKWQPKFHTEVQAWRFLSSLAVPFIAMCFLSWRHWLKSSGNPWMRDTGHADVDSLEVAIETMSKRITAVTVLLALSQPP